MLVSAVLYLTFCVNGGDDCRKTTFAKFYQGESGQLICAELAKQFNRVNVDEKGETMIYECKRQPEGTRG